MPLPPGTLHRAMVHGVQATSIADLMDLDEGGAIDNDEAGFDDQLWLLLTNQIGSPEEAANLPEPVWVYLASRWMEWEVANGGFAQAAENIPNWFPLGQRAYERLGLNRAAALIGRAVKLMAEQSAERRLGALDDELDGADWWADDVRLAYVRRNRDAFRRLDLT